MKRALLFATCSLALFATGCLHPKIGPHSLPQDRAQYSVSLADSWKQQTLLNIVKLRYMDPPVFMDIGNIVVSYSLTQSASLGGTIVPNGGIGASSSLALGGSATLSNTPTVTYTPLTGSPFIKGLITPLPPQSVFSAISNGVAADAILLSAVSSINGLKNQQTTLQGIAPADPEFHQVRALLRKIQLSGMVKVYAKEDASKQQTIIIAIPAKDIPPEILAYSREVRRLLRLNPEATEFKLVYGPVSSNDTEIAVLTRSILALMQNMAAQVEVPAEDLAHTFAFPGFEKDRDVPGIVPMIRIHSSKERPANPFVSVNYQDSWFWIDKGDLPSKQVFSQLMMLFTMVDTGPRENLPVITIPSR